MTVQKLLDLSGRVALVTGGYGIYGAPITEALAEAGAHVIIASRSHERCVAQAEDLQARGLHASGETYDQANEASILALRNQLVSKFGRVDVLVNNSVVRSMRKIDDPIECWRQSLDTNATGLFAICRAFLEVMLSARRGVLINVASVQAVVAPDFSNYVGTEMTTTPDYHFNKHGMIGLTKYLAAWAGPYGVRVNAISPGGFQTSDHSELFVRQYCRRVFLGRMAQHDDIKGAVVFLASDAASYITGQNLIIDGGYTC